MNTTKGKALIVDDEATNRMILQTCLANHGYKIIVAENGQQAIDKFVQESPDIVFMDVMMPIMDGYEATRKIKKISGENFIPVIFLTAITVEEELAQCVAAGGDDFLIKPFSLVLLKARLDAMERIRDLHRTVQTQKAKMLQDEEIAEEMFSQVVMAKNVELDKLKVLMKPAVTFSGDVLLSARSPSGDLYIILGDFTGHGLVAALGALPVSEVFRTMTLKGFSLESIVKEINRKLYTLLPADKFLALGFVSIHYNKQSASLLNAGIPDIFLINDNRDIKQKFPANHLALGIIDGIDVSSIYEIDFDENDILLMTTDGLIEANNPSGMMYGEERLEACIKSSTEKNIIRNIGKDLNDFTEEVQQHDDISILAIPFKSLMHEVNEDDCNRKININKGGKFEKINELTIWRYNFNIHNIIMARSDPIPVLVGKIQELEDIKGHSHNIFLILSELFNNALDHGVLKLNSRLKYGVDGFTEYLELREQRMDELKDINIMMVVQKISMDSHEFLKICCCDSGDGFDYTKEIERLCENTKLSGRGIGLLNELCDSIEYKGNGNEVEVYYQMDRGL